LFGRENDPASLVIPQHPRFVGKDPRTFSMGGSSRPPPNGNIVASRALEAGISIAVNATSH
jgi:hypothetical protein